MQIVTRKEAMERGLSRYFTGIPCPKGHISDRRVNGAECLRCVSDRKKIRPGNPEKIRSRRKRYYEKHKERITADQRERYYNASSDQKAMAREYQKAYHRKRREENGGYKPYKPVTVLDTAALDHRRSLDCCKTAIRRGAALPEGVTQKEIIEQTLYLFKLKRDREADTGIRHHIDHIIPIFAGGTHGPGNLQVLSESDHNLKTYSDRLRYGKRSAA